ncbi:hypothetical protein MAR_010807 [Mya arenaria]|uniref:Uncharacterized protein n=1 Tax=Mya arenaria TaxID=6604 RepID=A0ABY7FW63_MYAAR|nr:hypothetical protein MAR_010807 [Mya arenaria]
MAFLSNTALYAFIFAAIAMFIICMIVCNVRRRFKQPRGLQRGTEQRNPSTDPSFNMIYSISLQRDPVLRNCVTAYLERTAQTDRDTPQVDMFAGLPTYEEAVEKSVEEPMDKPPPYHLISNDQGGQV